LLRQLYLQFTPSSQLLRADSLRRRPEVYDESSGIVQGIDCQLVLDLLKESDFGFVYQVLTFTRVHSDSLSSQMDEYSVFYPERLILLRRFGHLYLTDEEDRDWWKREMAAYSRFLGRSVFIVRGKGFWQFHNKELRKLGCPLNPLTVAASALGELCRFFAEPMARIQLRRHSIKSRTWVSSRNV
jgi:hypothetical protein